jgi:polyphosphate kinase 2 (PPK2 family)
VIEGIDLSRKLKSADWQASRAALQERLSFLQGAARQCGMPGVIVVEGWDASGKGQTIATLVDRLDPHGYRVWPTGSARSHERRYPWLWRFWAKLPSRGDLAIFDRSWYGRVLTDRIEGGVSSDDVQRAYRDINDFEQMLVDDGYALVKLWLHISRDEQERRLRVLAKQYHRRALRIEGSDQNRRYPEYVAAVETMLRKTNTPHAPWTVVEAEDTNYCLWRALTSVAEGLERALHMRCGAITTGSTLLATAAMAT